MGRMNRRQFIAGSAGAVLASAAPSTTPATVLYGDKTVPVAQTRVERADVCIPLSKNLKKGEWFDLTGFADKLGQRYVSEGGVWSLGEIPVLRGSFYESRIAPDFAVPDRKGKVVHLSDFRGKKALIVTWASW